MMVFQLATNLQLKKAKNKIYANLLKNTTNLLFFMIKSLFYFDFLNLCDIILLFEVNFVDCNIQQVLFPKVNINV